MNTQTFWSVIGAYNGQTWGLQIVLLLFLLVMAALSYRRKSPQAVYLALGIANLWIALAFFACFGTQPVQRYFALPLFLLCGALFLYESRHSRESLLRRPDVIQGSLLALYLFYPLVSTLLGNRFPQVVTHIMPCPVVSLGIVVCSGCRRKNRLLLALLILWGLTGIKSVVFHAYEDIILLLCGLYGAVLLARELRRGGTN